MERTFDKQGTIRNIPKISVAIREQRLRFAGHCWRSEGELASDLLLWQPSHGKRFRGRPPLTYIDQLVKDTGCRTEELPAVMKGINGKNVL